MSHGNGWLQRTRVPYNIPSTRGNLKWAARDEGSEWLMDDPSDIDNETHYYAHHLLGAGIALIIVFLFFAEASGNFHSVCFIAS